MVFGEDQFDFSHKTNPKQELLHYGKMPTRDVADAALNEKVTSLNRPNHSLWRFDVLNILS